MIHEHDYQTLSAACRQMLSYRQKLAKPTLESAIQQHVGVELTNEQLLSHIFAESIMRRLDRKLVEAKNIYVEEFDIPQIEMFYKMAKAYPHILLSHNIANQYLFEAMEGFSEVTLLDIGIGKGHQVANLLRRLSGSRDHQKLKRVRVVGLDPDPSNLQDSKRSLRDLSSRVRFDVDFTAFNSLLEEATVNDLLEIRSMAKGALFINSSYAFHHIRHPLDDDLYRTDILAFLRQLRPRLLTLIEPSSDHDTEDIERRFQQCWFHFGKVFELIDESDLEAGERFSIKEKFFGREIRDIFGVSDRMRCERHEHFESWLLRLSRAGYRPFESSTVSARLAGRSWVRHTEGVSRMGFDDTVLIAVFAYSC